MPKKTLEQIQKSKGAISEKEMSRIAINPKLSQRQKSFSNLLQRSKGAISEKEMSLLEKDPRRKK